MISFAINNETVTFEENIYTLSWIDSRSNTITNEYLLPGENLNNWSSMIASRHFESVNELKQVLPHYMEKMKPLIASKPGFFKDNTIKSNHIIIELFLMAPDKSHYEYNLHLFFESPDGVKAYQYAEKIPLADKVDVSKQIKSRGTRMRILATMNLQHYKQEIKEEEDDF